jgi:mannitol/fructose-specific phosphotransferase system IIA component (Ntr-type)
VNGLDQFLSEDRILLDLGVKNAEEVIAELGRLLGGNDPVAQEEVREALLARERVSTTGIGSGVAFPHARVGFLKTTRLAFIRTSVPIEFKAMDGKGVDLFAALAAPIQSRREHLAVLSKLSYLFRSETVRRRFREAQNAAEVFDLLREGSSSVPASPGG